MTSREAEVGWSGASYEAVSAPQHAWGKKVLARLPLAGGGRVLDAGCGTGRVTRELLVRSPGVRVVGVDLSASMLDEARANLGPSFGDRVSFERADLVTLDLGVFDAIVSTATFHWITDHAALFARLYASLRPGGRLVAQCGGDGNLARLYGRARALDGDPRFAEWLAGYEPPHHFAGVDETRARLVAAGFADVDVWLEPEPTPFASRDDFVAFVRSVVVRHELAALPDEPTRERYLGALADLAARDEPPFLLDYVRLNFDATRPSALLANRGLAVFLAGLAARAGLCARGATPSTDERLTGANDIASATRPEHG